MVNQIPHKLTKVPKGTFVSIPGLAVYTIFMQKTLNQDQPDIVLRRKDNPFKTVLKTKKGLIFGSLLSIGVIAIAVGTYLGFGNAKPASQQLESTEYVSSTYEVIQDALYYNGSFVADADPQSFVALVGRSQENPAEGFDATGYYVDGVRTESTVQGDFEIKKFDAQTSNNEPTTYTYLRRGAVVYSIVPYGFESPGPFAIKTDLDLTSTEILQSVSPVEWYVADKNGVYFASYNEHVLLEGAQAKEFRLLPYPELGLLTASNEDVYYIQHRLVGLRASELRVYENEKGAVVFRDADSAWVRCVYRVINTVRAVSLSEAETHPVLCPESSGY